MACNLYETSLFIFRRDLRLVDNSALNAAMRQSRRVIGCFIFDPRQIQSHPYQSATGLQFMLESLLDLQQQFQQHSAVLYLFDGRPEEVIQRLNQDLSIEAVFVNRDYSPFSRQRDAELQNQCERMQVAFHSLADLLLVEPEHVVRGDGKPYQVFTAFHRQARLHPVAPPQDLAVGELYGKELAAHQPEQLDQLKQNHSNALFGGRRAALAQLNRLGNCADYARLRDMPALGATGQLSAYLKFGCCSVREVFHAIQSTLDPDHPLLRQLYWRDFFSHIGWHFPHVFGHAFKSCYDAIAWRNNLDDFHAWADGRTGFPIVDAGMRELKHTGLMHNRVRMIVASFLIKDLHISWRWGERYFARHLLDYDPCVNNGNWQWAASTGCDAQPYFRIFNPWLQQRKFDPDCLYIKRWLPELRNIPNHSVHHWETAGPSPLYPAPMLDHSQQSQQCKRLFQHAQTTA